MLNKTKFTILGAVVLLFTFAQSVRAQENHKEFTEWAELKNFHEVISKTFHPMEEGNFKPIRELSGELYERAIRLAASKVPADIDRPEVVNAVKELEKETGDLDELIHKKGEDADVKKLLTTVHESFHKIVGFCTKGEHHEEPAGK